MTSAAFRPSTRRYLGMEPGDLEGKPYARYWNPDMAPLPEDIRAALAHGPVAEPLLPDLAHAPPVLEGRRSGLEVGYCLARGGGAHVALRTPMPEVAPAMIDWWFAWHNGEPERYKLWHPRAHVHAEWHTPPPAVLAETSVGSLSMEQGSRRTGERREDRVRPQYVGGVSCVDEYIGSECGRYLIRFIPPGDLGFDPALLADPGRATVISASVGFARLPLDIGYLAHYVRAVPGGSEMRSRFWIGGPYARPRAGGIMGELALQAVKLVRRPGADVARALLVHCSQEMSHLASFLPRLHAELGNECRGAL